MKFITEIDKWKSVETEADGELLQLIIGYDNDPIGDGRELVLLSKEDCKLLAAELLAFASQK